jgi:subtilisin-like proprotein convertase family protein
MAPLIGQAVQGTWTLHVTDLAAMDIGKLNKWTLNVKVTA